MEAKDRIIVALDVDKPQKAIVLVEILAPVVGLFKIGLQFITAMLVSVIAPTQEEEALVNFEKIRGLFYLLNDKILWDGKFDDIPNTVGKAVAEVAKLRVKMLNVHASAGKKSVEAAVANTVESLVLGVTVLTSIDTAECRSIFGDEPGAKVLQFSKMLFEAGADGIICSPKELELLSRQPILKGLLKVTPGIRAADAPPDDQKRTMTSAEAIRAGADYLVIGRPITGAPDPVAAAVAMAADIAAAEEEMRTA